MRKFYVVNHFSSFGNVELTSSLDYIISNNFNNFSYQQYEFLSKDMLVNADASFCEALEKNQENCAGSTSSVIIEYSLSEDDMFAILTFNGLYPYIDASPTNIWYFIKNESLGTMKEVFKKETRIYA